MDTPLHTFIRNLTNRTSCLFILIP
jgi:hypothetical protein